VVVALWADEDRDGAGVGHHVLPDLVDAREVLQHLAPCAREHSTAAGRGAVRVGVEQRHDAAVRGNGPRVVLVIGEPA
jgi:hypothetical protein